MINEIDILKELLYERKWVEFRDRASAENPADLAMFMEGLEGEMLLKAFRLLPKDMAVDVFSYLGSDDQLRIIVAASGPEVGTLINEMFIDDAVDLFEELPASVVKKVLANTSEDTRRQINQLLRYPEASAGSIMTTEYVDLKEYLTAGEAIERIKRIGVDKETIYTCYVTNESRKLIGIVALRTLLLARPDVLVGDIMERNVISVETGTVQEEVAADVSKYDLIAMPVVDSENRLVGIITIDDVVDVIQEENTEDFERMAAMLPSEEPYLKTSVFKLARNRVVWLLILMVSATISGKIIQRYDELLINVVILASFTPMLMDTGGNAGSQASTLIIRGMALGEIQLKDAVRIIRKELSVAALVAVVLSMVGFLKAIIIDQAGVPIALVVAISLACTVIIAKVLGAILPMVASAFHIDPAIMAGPTITTIVDACALTIYFWLASTIIGMV